MSSLRYVLELPDGDSGDPMFSVRALDGGNVGDTFLAGSALQRFRILAIDAEAPGVLDGHADRDLDRRAARRASPELNASSSAWRPPFWVFTSPKRPRSTTAWSMA